MVRGQILFNPARTKDIHSGNEEFVRIVPWLLYIPVAYPDLQIRRGPCHRDPEISGGERSPKKFLSALRASVWSKNNGVARATPALALDPTLHSQGTMKGAWLMRF